MKETPAFRQTTGDCPPIEVWGLVSLGRLPDGQTERYLAHAASCAECGRLLRQATAAMDEDESDEETAGVARLTATTELWQEQMAQRLAQVVSANVEKRKPKQNPFSWSFLWPRYSWQMGVCTLMLVAAVSVSLWYRAHHSVGHLIAQAYGENRILELRIPGANYSPLRPESVLRGGNSVPDQPASLLEARGMIAHQLEHDPQNPRWLELEARAHLLDGNLDRSLDTTSHLLLTHPLDRDVLLDNAVAYFERGRMSDSPQDIGTSVELLGQLLAHSPKDTVALYNQAIAFEHLYQYENAARTWRTFVSLEKDSAWLDDGKRHLKDVEGKLKVRQGYIENQPLDGQQMLSLMADKSKIPKQDEELSTTKLPELLRAAYPQANAICNNTCISARSVLSSLADSLKSNHNDSWLSELLASNVNERWIQALWSLADAIQSNAKGSPSEGLRAANAAIDLFAAEKNGVGETRARVEQVYAYQRLLDGENCLQASQQLEKRLSDTTYIWMQGQFSIDYSSCYAIRQRYDEEQTLLARANELAKAHRYAILGLRAMGITAALDNSLGDYESAWKRDIEGLHQYWSGSYPALRAFQFYSDLGYAESARSRPYLSLAILQEALATVIPLHLDSVEVALRFRMVEALIRVWNASQAEKELGYTQSKFANLPDARQLHFYMAEGLIGIARLKAESHDTDAANKLLARAEAEMAGDENPHLKFALVTTRGSLLMQAGKWQQALQSLTTAAQWAESEGDHLTSADERLSWLRQMEPIYAGMTLANFQLSHNAEQSLALWERYRGQLLGSDYAMHCLKSEDHCLVNAIQTERNQLQKGGVLGNIVFDHGVLVWRLDKDGVAMHFVEIPRHELMRKAEVFTQLVRMSDGNDEDLKNYGRELFRILVGSAWHGYDAGQPIYLETDASLSSVPFAALPFLDGYWGLVAPLSNVVSILEDEPGRSDDLRKTLTGVQAGRSLVIGNPKLPAAVAPPLPDAAEEARFVAGMLPSPTLLVGAEAQREAVLRALPSASIFHFAGHTQSWSSRTRLLLSAASISADAVAQYPSALESADILQVRPKKCLLAVLSACSTGNRETLDANVVSDIVSSFAEAGVPQIIATHWSVDSASSAALMRSFYTELMAGSAVPTALERAQAQLATQGYRPPRYWASFYAVGFARPYSTETHDGYSENKPLGSTAN